MKWRDLPPLSALRAFCAFSQEGTMSAAGAALNVSHAAISQQLRGLEEHLGVALLDHSGARPVMTEAGQRLADALEQPVSLFFGAPDAPADERGYVVRANARRSLGTSDEGLVEQLLSPDLGGSFEIVRSVFAPSAELSEPAIRPTEEAGYIVSGSLDLWIGERQFHLSEGDSFRFTEEAYRWRNPGSQPCIAIWVIAPPVY